MKKKWPTWKNLDKLTIYFYLNRILWAFRWQTLLVSLCYGSINKSVSIFRAQFVLDLFFFFEQFQSHCFFLSKNQSLGLIKTTKKENKRKQLSIKVLRILILGEKYIVCNLSLGQCSWGQFSLGQLCRRQIIGKAIFLGGNFQGYIVRGQLSLGAIFQEQSSRGQFSLGAIFLEGNCPDTFLCNAGA